jgi:hypothetical protein
LLPLDLGLDLASNLALHGSSKALAHLATYPPTNQCANYREKHVRQGSAGDRQRDGIGYM